MLFLREESFHAHPCHGPLRHSLANPIKSEFWPKAKRVPHRWAPEQGYVTFMARHENDGARNGSLFNCPTIFLPAPDAHEKIHTISFPSSGAIRADHGRIYNTGVMQKLEL